MGPAITILRKERNAGMRVGILSDTHGLLRSEVKEVLRTCDVILHGGDINRETIIKELEELAPLHVVRGNNDKEWAEGMPEELSFSLEGVSFYMIHNKKEASPEAVSDPDVVLYGHSHRYDERIIDGTLWLNPGSCGPRRFHQPITMAVMTLEGGTYQVEKLEFAHEKKGGEDQ